METILVELERLVAKGGPNNKEWKMVDNLFGNKHTDSESLTKVSEMSDGFDFLNSENSIMGHIRLKPYGYAGDYHIIDRIYTFNSSAAHNNWDNYSLQTPPAEAVRNRKAYFKQLLETYEDNGAAVLNVASGPCRGLKEYATNRSDSKLSIRCIDHDKRAIEYAKELLGSDRKVFECLEFVKANIFKHEEYSKYDLIWSAGLFDYFDDEVFVQLISKLYAWVSPEGKLVIGNFSQKNPGRLYMELIGQWFLHHRSEEHLRTLALKAGISNENISVGQEPLGVNLFLHITKTQ